jgi:hypothetical protein
MKALAVMLGLIAATAIGGAAVTFYLLWHHSMTLEELFC